MTGRAWTEQELEILRRLYPIGNMAELLDALPGRTRASTQTKARDLGIRKTNEGRSRCMVGARADVLYWTPDEDQMLRELWQTASIREVYRAFAGIRSPRSVRYRVEALRLKRPPALVSKIRSEVAKRAAEASIKIRAENAVKVAQQEIDALQMVQKIVPAQRAQAVSMSRVMAHPLEAAWRGAL